MANSPYHSSNLLQAAMTRASPLNGFLKDILHKTKLKSRTNNRKKGSVSEAHGKRLKDTSHISFTESTKDSFLPNAKHGSQPKTMKERKFLYGGRKVAADNWFPCRSRNCVVRSVLHRTKMRRNILNSTTMNFHNELPNFRSFEQKIDSNQIVSQYKKPMQTCYNHAPTPILPTMKKSRNGGINKFLRRLHESMRMNNRRIENHRMDLRGNKESSIQGNLLENASNCFNLLRISSAFKHKRMLEEYCDSSKGKAKISIKIPSNIDHYNA
eukprot:TRINITY_DN7953_c0_g1_i2.p1 TRINITY_DN7953_c0_g1~~TRINITY_DN7953_c0_g1_i2.p1  ORF type:complete len:269 (+),score=31.65 TRINITY_DN7953_c0_g1_i2:163-969(+)